MERYSPGVVLLVRVQATICSLPVRDVIETMRPLPVLPLTDVPAFVAGISLIRGIPTPVIELGALFQPNHHAPPGRFVTVRVAGRVIALAVQTVIGIAELNHLDATSLPALLNNARTDAIEAIGRLDSDVLVVLQTAKLVPESVWSTLNLPRWGAEQ